MKTRTVTIMVLACILLCGGCEFVSGVGTGAAVIHAANQAENALVETTVMLQEKKAEAEERLKTLEDEEGRAELIAAIAAYDSAIVEAGTYLAAVRLGKQGVGTNWADPEAVGAFSAAIISAALAMFYRKRGKVAVKKYDAHKAGVDATRLANPTIAAELTEKIGDERVKVGLSVMKIPK